MTTLWDTLTEGQQDAAVVLGWTPETWADALFVPPLASGLSSAQRAAVTKLGYSNLADWDALDRGWLDTETAEEEADAGTDWSGRGRKKAGSEEESSGSRAPRSALWGPVLRLLAAGVAGAALCFAAEEAGVLPEAPPAAAAATATTTAAATVE